MSPSAKTAYVYIFILVCTITRVIIYIYCMYKISNETEIKLEYKIANKNNKK